jgi:hypothetical protein
MIVLLKLGQIGLVFSPSQYTWLPTLVDGGFGRAVKPEDDEIPLARHRR